MSALQDVRPPNRVTERWSGGGPALCAWMSTGSALVAETLAATGVDAVIVDMQHGEATLPDVFRLLPAIELRGAEPFVRVPSSDAALIGRVLDMGATGIVVPMVESPEEAASIVRAVRYPPHGARSFGPRRPTLRHGAACLDRAEAAIVVLAMIETAPALAVIDAIVATPGLDGVFVGPADLALSLGERPGDAGRATAEAISRVAGAARGACRRAGVFCPSSEVAAARLAEGFDLVTLGTDLVAVERHAAAGLALLALRSV